MYILGGNQKEIFFLKKEKKKVPGATAHGTQLHLHGGTNSAG